MIILKKKRPGRPSGKVKTAKIEVAIEPKIKDTFMETLEDKDIQASVLLREWIINYIEDQNKK